MVQEASFEVWAEIIEHKALAQDVYLLCLKAPEIVHTAVPGQFVMVDCGPEYFLDRPLGIYDCDLDQDILKLAYFVVGKGTRALSHKFVGDCVRVIGPLGHGFALKEAPAILVGGGTGLFPLHFLARRLNVPTTMIAGFRDRERCFALKDFEKATDRFVLCLEAGEAEVQGTAIDGLRGVLSEDQDSTIKPAVYLCGPRGMMKAGAELALSKTPNVQVSLEERMACGVGFCTTCSCQLTHGRQARVCYEGPVFDAKEVAW